MSDAAVRVALVAEGWTDKTVVEAAVSALLAGRRYSLQLLQPEDPQASGPFAKPLPGGWTGVYRWCREAVDRAGRLRHDIVFRSYDVLILHLDADVAAANYAGAHIHDAPNPADLPCVGPEGCPPKDSADSLRRVLLRWVGEASPPPLVVFCTPSKSIEAWVLAALYPNDPDVTSGGLEAIAEPANLLQAKPAAERLVRSGKKDRKRYDAKQSQIAVAWPFVRTVCRGAERFSVEFLREVPKGD